MCAVCVNACSHKYAIYTFIWWNTCVICRIYNSTWLGKKSFMRMQIVERYIGKFHIFASDRTRGTMLPSVH